MEILCICHVSIHIYIYTHTYMLNTYVQDDTDIMTFLHPLAVTHCLRDRVSHAEISPVLVLSHVVLRALSTVRPKMDVQVGSMRPKQLAL